MSSSWLWQPFGSCFCSIMVPTSQYCLPLTSGLENSVEQPYSWKIAHPCLETLKLATLHRSALLGLGPGQVQGPGPGPGPGPGHRAPKPDHDHDRLGRRDRDRYRATGPQQKRGRRATETGPRDRPPGPAGPPGPNRDPATGTGPPGPGHTTRQK